MCSNGSTSSSTAFSRSRLPKCSPTGNPTVSLLVTFGAFGLAYVVRPLGAIVVGGYTDRAGRKAGLLLSMALMMIGTTLMAVTPGYATIGLAAPIIITLSRLL